MPFLERCWLSSGIEEGFAYAKPYSEQKQRVNSGQGRDSARGEFISTLERRGGTPPQLAPWWSREGAGLRFQCLDASAVVVEAIEVLVEPAFDTSELVGVLALRRLHAGDLLVHNSEVTGDGIYLRGHRCETVLDDLGQIGKARLRALRQRRDLFVKELVELFDLLVCHMDGLSHVRTSARQEGDFVADSVRRQADAYESSRPTSQARSRAWPRLEIGVA